MITSLKLKVCILSSHRASHMWSVNFTQNHLDFRSHLVLLFQHGHSSVPVVANASCLPSTIVARGVGLVLQSNVEDHIVGTRIIYGWSLPIGSQSVCPSPCKGWKRRRASFLRTGCRPEKRKMCTYCWNMKASETCLMSQSQDTSCSQGMDSPYWYWYLWPINLWHASHMCSALMYAQQYLDIYNDDIWDLCEQSGIPQFVGKKVGITGNSSDTAHLHKVFINHVVMCFQVSPPALGRKIILKSFSPYPHSACRSSQNGTPLEYDM